MKNRPLEEAFEAIHDHIIDAIDHFLREKTVDGKNMDKKRNETCKCKKNQSLGNVSEGKNWKSK